MKILTVCFSRNCHPIAGVETITAPLWDDVPGPNQKSEINRRLNSQPFIGADINNEPISLEQLKEMMS